MSEQDRIAADLATSTEGQYQPTLDELLSSTESGECSLHPDISKHAAVEALLRDRARLLADLGQAKHPRRRDEIRRELRRVGIRLARLGVPAAVRRAR